MPGLLVVRHQGGCAFSIRNADGEAVALAYTRADAGLFAAAPELLAALRMFLGDHLDQAREFDDASRCGCGLCLAGEAAIAKAEGK